MHLDAIICKNREVILLNDFKNEMEFIKNAAKSNIKINKSADNFMEGFDKREVQKKLRELGMGNLADKLEPMSNQAIESMLRQNPQILKKALEIFNNGRQ